MSDETTIDPNRDERLLREQLRALQDGAQMVVDDRWKVNARSRHLRMLIEEGLVHAVPTGRPGERRITGITERGFAFLSEEAR